ncbi:MAG: hypothetical protein MK207_05765 [Saprospiraceae bacterium]|nr:hypothetical protein [Saprospiraceae bacterium]
MKVLIYLFWGIIYQGVIYAQFVPGQSYYGANNYIEYIAGDMPIIFVAPHAGNLEPINLPDINTRGSDNGTMEQALFFADSFHLKTGGCRPHIIINHLKPNKLNPVFSESDSTISAGTHPIALQALNDFHNFIQIAYNKVSADWGKGHYFELHGNGTPEEWNMIGLGVSKTFLNMSDSIIMTRVNNSTIKNLCTVGGADFLEVLKGPTSLGGLLDSLGWKSSPSPTHPAPPDTVTFFYAGQNTWRYGSKNNGEIDATHLESYWKFMVLSANKSKYSNDLADAIISFMNIHYGFNFNCQTIGLNKIHNKPTFFLYPNPASSNEFLYIESPNTIKELFVFNTIGQLFKVPFYDKNKFKLNLKPDTYIIFARTSNGKLMYQKLVVQ